MIQINKPDNFPEILNVTGSPLVRGYCAEYDADPDSYRSGRTKFSVDKGVYGDRTVKEALLAAQNDKCCYCEKKFRAVAYGEVEHYRPKTACQQAVGEPKEYPGYYWLAYAWNNLFVSCEVCNRTFKRILFPLVNPANRARSHNSSLDLEEPLLVNPSSQNPREHIRFRNEALMPLTEAGRVTVKVLGLRRPELDEDRRTALDQLRRCSEIVRLGRDDDRPEMQILVAETAEFLRSVVRPEAEFSSMAIDFLS